MKHTNFPCKIVYASAFIFLLSLSVKVQAQLPITISYKWKPPFNVSESINNSIPFWGLAHFYPSQYIEYNLNNINQSHLSQEMLVFTRVHEYGHIINKTSDEATTDCWASKQLAQTDPQIINAAINWMDSVMANVIIYDGSNGRQRAAWMRQCVKNVSSASPSWFYIQSRVSNLFLDVNGGSRDVGGAIVQANQNPNQVWKFIPSETKDYYYIQTVVSGLYLDVDGGKKNVGNRIDQAKQDHEQIWKLIPAGDGYYYIQSKVSGLNLDVNGGSKDVGASIVQAKQDPNQAWKLIPAFAP